ncbi:MAG: glycosyl transferase [Clostridia bacterium]|nr:glycosyl transferase [Clostridia bacterium]MBR4443815.1 glycosyl transferase [Clostridia bacterium]
MKILILSCNTGGGHNTAARAMKEEIERQGHTAVLEDYLAMANQATSDLISNSYIGMARHSPHFFGMIYRASMAVSTTRHLSPIYYANIPIAKRLAGYLAENPCDGIVMTHLFAMEAISYLKRRGAKLPVTVAIATDYTCQPFWEDLECDYYILPHEDLTDEYARRGLPREKLRAYGIPVSSRFSDEADRAEARARLNLPEDAPLFLVMGGSMGSGHILKFTEQLHNEVENGIIAVICGSNERLLNSMKESFGHIPNIRVIGYTNDVADYMAACDVLYTKPGGLTSTEALVRNVPLIHTAPIPGCETANSRFFEEHGISFSAHTIEEQIRYGCELARNAAIQRDMQRRQSENAHPDAARKILALIEEQDGRRDAKDSAN